MKKLLTSFILVLSIIMGQITPISWAEEKMTKDVKASESNTSKEYEETEESKNYIEVEKDGLIGNIADYENGEVYAFQFAGALKSSNGMINFAFDEYSYKDEIYNDITTIEFFVKLGNKMEYVASRNFILNNDLDRHRAIIDREYFDDQEYIYARIGKSMDKDDDYYCGTLLFKVLNPFYKGGGEVVNIPDKKLHRAINDSLGQEAYTPVTKYRMSQVKEINLEDSRVKNLDGLQYCVNLEYLFLENNEIEDISPISNLTKLKVLNLNENNIKDISFIKNLTNLTKLYLKQNQITSVSNLKNLSKLNTLILERNKISNISYLSELKNLTYLNVGSNNISDISVVENFSKLKHFRGSQNKITDISPLGKLPNITELHLSTQRIELGPMSIKEEKFIFKNPLIGLDKKPIAPSRVRNGGTYSKTSNTITWNNPFYSVEYRFSHKLGVSGTDYTGDFYISLLTPMSYFSVNSINKTSTTITGKGDINSTVRAYVNNKKIGTTAKVDWNGNFTIKSISGLKAGDKVVVKISQDGYETTKKTIIVRNIFTTFTVNSINNKSTAISGKGLKTATVKAYINGKQVGTTAKVDSTGNYTIKNISGLKAGSKVVVKISKDGYETKQNTATVLNTFSTFTVNSITTKSTSISGKGLKTATVKAYLDGKQIGKTVAVNASGTYKIAGVKNLKKGKKVEVKISKSGYLTKSKTVTIK